MCGIFGVIKPELPDRSQVETACLSLSHRGPNDSGLLFDLSQGIALGHRRLSIIDLSADGHQPFFSADSRYVIVFNGEIYNYLEIREELKNFYNFKTKTDTEVLQASYIKWGESCLQKFNGMFAFAIWDKVERKLFCARDRLGIKPFYYHFYAGDLYFSSEIKALLKVGVKPKVNEKVVFEYLYYGFYDHSDDTFFSGIKTLSPGHYLLWQNERIAISKYWDLADKQVDYTNLSEQEAIDKLSVLLEDSIKLRFRSDVPVGLNLSSGLDSNSLYYYALKITGHDLHTFSICLESGEYNECDLISDLLTPANKTFWHSHYIDPPDLLAATRDMNIIQDQPYGGIPTISYKNLIELSDKEHVTVLLEGQGVDEILAGYPYYQVDYDKDKKGIVGMGSLVLGQDKTKLINADILSTVFKDQYKNHELFFPQPFKSSLLNAQYRDIRYTKLPRVLRFNDHVTMHFGKELRLPFLDYRIVEFCFFLPPELKLNNETQKYILRKLMEGVVPQETRDRKKKVFGAIQT